MEMSRSPRLICCVTIALKGGFERIVNVYGNVTVATTRVVLQLRYNEVVRVL